MLKILVVSGTLLGVVAEGVKPNLDPLKMSLAQLLNADNHTIDHVSTSTSTGSMVFSYYDSQCNGAASSAVGYTLGSCITSDGESGIAYMSCSAGAGGDIKYTLKSCSSGDCTSGCSTYDLTFPECSSGQRVTCSTKSQAWTEFKELDYHYEFYYGDSSCDGDMDMWTAMKLSCSDIYNTECTHTNSLYSFLGHCDQ